MYKRGEGIAGQVLKRLKDRERPERGKRTLVLTVANYESFEKLCKQEGKYPSEVVDEFIAMFVADFDESKSKKAR